MRKTLVAVLLAILFLPLNMDVIYADGGYKDVPEGHWASNDINSIKAYGIGNEQGDNTFGLGKIISRGEFVGFLAKMLGNDVNNDIENINAPVTREEMAVLIITAMGYDRLAEQLNLFDSPFSDVVSHSGYITMASDFNIISGMDNGLFMPESTATKEQAVVMLMRMYRAMNNEISFKNGFYAIRSASQASFINGLNSTCFGWSRLEINDGAVSLNTTSGNNNEYRIPDGYAEPLSMAKANGKALLMVTSTDNEGVSGYVLPEGSRNSVIDMILQAVEGGSGPVFDGVVIDFENLKGSQTRSEFTGFLAALKSRLNDRLMYVAVHPQGKPGLVYYDAYDFKAIGETADKVILMAHDYNAKKLTDEEMLAGVTFTPISPIDEVYYSIRAITDKKTGVADKSKILFQLSFGSAQWKSKDGVVIHNKPYNPDYESITNRIPNAEMNYSQKYENPYLTFHSSDDNINNIVWYEDERSISAKLKLAKIFGISGVSVWRMGNIPDYQIEGKEAYLKVLDFLNNYR